jgi:hypothetical protein
MPPRLATPISTGAPLVPAPERHPSASFNSLPGMWSLSSWPQLAILSQVGPQRRRQPRARARKFSVCIAHPTWSQLSLPSSPYSKGMMWARHYATRSAWLTAAGPCCGCAVVVVFLSACVNVCVVCALHAPQAAPPCTCERAWRISAEMLGYELGARRVCACLFRCVCVCVSVCVCLSVCLSVCVCVSV